jgi:hypothetical protein
MTSSSRCLVAAGIFALTLAPAGEAQTQTISAPAVPPEIQVPAGNIPFLKTIAAGTQNYVCRLSPAGFGWTLFGPQATLFLTIKWFNGEIRQQVATHFLSQNPAENNDPRPTWQSSLDTSAVWGKLVAASTDPQFVAPGAIAWLLLEPAGKQRGPTGGDFLTQTTYIQRVNTSGGIAPATGCSESTAGATVLVPYTTDYYFFKAARPR